MKTHSKHTHHKAVRSAGKRQTSVEAAKAVPREREEQERKERLGIIVDQSTGLEWVVGPDQDTDWDEAKRWVEELTLDGGGWRMPTVSELKGLYLEDLEVDGSEPRIHPAFEGKMTGWWVWSGETGGNAAARYFFFVNGGEYCGYRSTSDRCRCFAVRSR